VAASVAPAARPRNRPGDGRVWYPAGQAPLVGEPGRVVCNALLAGARRARGCRTRGDDRLETSVYAVKRFLHRQAHGERSGRFARATEDLVAGLASIMGWGPVPPRGSAERGRFFRRHRASVQRWLGELEAMGLIEVDAQKDNQGFWWRVVITLLEAPTPPPEDVAGARRRLRAWKRRERARRRRARPPRRRLQAILRNSQRPRRATRARLARRRAHAVHEHRRQCELDAVIADARDRRGGIEASRQDLRHPFGAPPPSALPPSATQPLTEPATPVPPLPPAPRSQPTLLNSAALVEPEGARAGEIPTATPARTAANGQVTIENEGPGPGSAGFDAVVLARVAAREHATVWRRAEAARQAVRRAGELAAWPAGRRCPLGRLREAWVVFRHGAATAGEAGSAAAGPRYPDLGRRAARAIALYERFADQRPAGWPTGGAAAITALAAQHRARTLAGDIGRLHNLAKAMRATALAGDPARLERLQRRAAARQPAPDGPLAFRRPGGPAWETGEQRRLRVRDTLLLAGEDPGRWPNVELADERLRDARETDDHTPQRPALVPGSALPSDWLDGITAWAHGYREQRQRGLWTLPDRWPTPDQDHAPR
jgi:hypothetical protein